MLSQYYIRSVSPNWLEEHTGQHEKEVPFPLETIDLAMISTTTHTSQSKINYEMLTARARR